MGKDMRGKVDNDRDSIQYDGPACETSQPSGRTGSTFVHFPGLEFVKCVPKHHEGIEGTTPGRPERTNDVHEKSVVASWKLPTAKPPQGNARDRICAGGLSIVESVRRIWILAGGASRLDRVRSTHAVSAHGMGTPGGPRSRGKHNRKQHRANDVRTSRHHTA